MTLIERLYERHCQGDDLCGEAQRELERRGEWHYAGCRKIIYDKKSSPCTCEAEVIKRITELETELSVARRNHEGCHMSAVKKLSEISALKGYVAELEAELATANNQLSSKRPTSFGTYKWACGHEGSSVCKQCWDEKLAELKQAREQSVKDLSDWVTVADDLREQIRVLELAVKFGKAAIGIERERIAAYEREWRPRLKDAAEALAIAETWPKTVAILEKALTAIPETSNAN